MSGRLPKYIQLTSALAALAFAAPQDAYAACVSSLISITVISSNMRFGTLVPCTASTGQVLLNEKNGTRTTAGCISNLMGAFSLPRVRIKANQSKNNEKVVVALPTTFNVNNGTTNMAVTAASFDKGNGFQTVVMNGQDTKTYSVGATLNVATSQPKGTYNGTFTVTGTCQ